MDLSTTYLGLKLRTPLVIAASPLSEEIGIIKEMEDAGASAVVLYSLFEEQLRGESVELAHHLEHGTFSNPEALTYFPEPEEFRLGPEEYLDHIAKAKKSVQIPIIASLNGSSVGGWTQYAKAIQQAGADALELNIYAIPTDLDLTSAKIEQNYLEIVGAVKSAVSIPVAVKLSPFFTNFANMAKRLDLACKSNRTSSSAPPWPCASRSAGSPCSTANSRPTSPPPAASTAAPTSSKCSWPARTLPCFAPP